MIAFLVVAGTLALVLALVVALAVEPGPGPDDVALGFEEAWDRLDFETVWTVAGPELRDGLGRADFVAAKRAAYGGQPLHHLADTVALESVVQTRDAARVRTRLGLRDGGAVHHELRLRRRGGRWEVIGYVLADDAPA